MMTTFNNLQPGDSSTIASWARFVLSGLQSKGLDTNRLLADAGIAKADLDNPNHRINVRQMTKLWSAAARDTGDPCFTLDLADQAQPDMFSGLGLAILFSDNIGDAIQRMCRYSTVASNAARLRSTPLENNALEVIFDIQLPVAGEALEAFMACGLSILKQITRGEFRPLEVHFIHDKTAHQQRFEEFFDAPVFFNASECKFVLDKQVLALPCCQSNPELARSIESWMSEYLEQNEALSFLAQVRKVLLEGVIDGCVDQAMVAGRLSLSTRALQRKLKKDGYTFRELHNEALAELAEKLLLKPELSLTDICYLLGFSDQSNFTKAFRRWKGTTPSDYRRVNLTL